MRIIYIVMNKTMNKEILRTPNRVLAYRLLFKNENEYVVCMRKERV